MNFETPVPEVEKTAKEREAALIAEFEKSEYWLMVEPGSTHITIKQIIELSIHYGDLDGVEEEAKNGLGDYNDLPEKYYKKAEVAKKAQETDTE